MSKFIVKLPPHQLTKFNITFIMFTLAVALMPSILLSIYQYGWRVLLIFIISMTSSVIFEWTYEKIEGKHATFKDLLEGRGSITGALMALTLPVTLPLQYFIIGSFLSIVIGKMVFGGFGTNIFNPALVGRMALLIAVPSQVNHYVVSQSNLLDHGLLNFTNIDAVSSATVLSASKEIVSQGGHLPYLMTNEWIPLLLGNVGGSIGEVSAIAVVAGGLFLLVARVISWQIPFFYIGTFMLLNTIFWYFMPGKVLDPITGILSGGILFGAFFMATDFVTSPLYKNGKIIFGIGLGLMTILIRVFGSYPEGVGFAILFMNAVTPLIDKYTIPRPFGMRG